MGTYTEEIQDCVSSNGIPLAIVFLVPVCASGHRHEEVQEAEGLDIKPQPVNVATLGKQAHMRSRVLASLPRSSVAKRPHTSFDSMSYMLLFP